jgi:hypothetical protein
MDSSDFWWASLHVFGISQSQFPGMPRFYDPRWDDPLGRECMEDYRGQMAINHARFLVYHSSILTILP